MTKRRGFYQTIALGTALVLTVSTLSFGAFADETDTDAVYAATADEEEYEAEDGSKETESLLPEASPEAQEDQELIVEESSEEESAEDSSSEQEADAVFAEDSEPELLFTEDTVEEAEELMEEALPEEPVQKEEAAEEETDEFALAGDDSGVIADGRIYWEVKSSGDKKTLRFSLVNATITADIPDYEALKDRPWDEHASSITDVEVGPNVTGIGKLNFSGFSKLSKVSLPAAGFTAIHEQAFTNCPALKEISIPATVTSIGSKVFEGDTGIVIKGSFSSAAEDYALANSIRFVPSAVTDLSGSQLVIAPTEFIYDGTAKQITVTLKYSKTTLVQGLDYSLNIGDNVNAGTKTLTVTGTGNYSGSKTAQYTIKPASIKSGTVSGIKSKKGYTGRAVTQDPVVVVNGKTLKEGTDYELTYKNNTKQPNKQKKKYVNASVTITGKGNYSDDVTKNFQIVKSTIKKNCLSKVPAKTYTGKAITPKVTVKIDGVTLKKNRDYTIKYSNNTNVGTAKIVVKGKGNFKGTAKTSFKIKKVSVEDASLSGLKDRTYTGKEIKPDLTLKIKKRTLKEGTDYSVSYSNNLKAGTATVTIKGKNNYKGKRVEHFEISTARMSSVKISNIKDMPYTGNPVKQSPVVKLGDVTLQEGRDYSISYNNNVNIGTATMIFTGKGSMTGERSANFRIKQFKISDASISGITNKEYTGNPITQSISVRYGDRSLKAGKDYSVSYSNNVSVGTAQVTITGLNGYTGSVTKSFTISPQGTSFKSINLAVKRLTITWNPKSNIDGYWLQYGTDSSFNTYLKNLKLPASRTEYIANVPNAGTKYYARICTYKDVDGKRYYSKWH